MRKIHRRIIVMAGAAAVVLGGAGAAAAASDDTDTPITGDALRQATNAALAKTGGGRVTGTEGGAEGSYHEVGGTRDDASQVDVQLDDHFAVVTTMSDSESGHGTGG